MTNHVGIIGATGFIGSEVALKFKNSGVHLYLCSRNGGTLHGIHSDSVDVTNHQSLCDWLSERDIDTLIYLSSIVPKSFEDADWNLFEYNLKMHNAILSVWKEKKFHLIYASSCSVYSKISSTPWSELTAIMPDNLYSISKFVGELLFYMEYQTKKMPVTILRINAPYGIDNRIKTVVNIFLERALAGEPLLLYGTGNREQDFLYVKDVAYAFWQAFQKQKFGIYNIASGKTITMRELAELIVSLTDSKSEIIYSGNKDPQENVNVSIEISKAENELGFIPQYSLSAGILDCVYEYKKRRID